jgi:hypothetical protein
MSNYILSLHQSNPMIYNPLVQTFIILQKTFCVKQVNDTDVEFINNTEMKK